MIILIYPQAKVNGIGQILEYPIESGIIKCDSFEKAIALLAENSCLDPIVTFAPTADILDTVLSKFQNTARRTLVVICGVPEDQSISTQSYLVEACQKLIEPAKDGAN